MGRQKHEKCKFVPVALAFQMLSREMPWAGDETVSEKS